MTIAEADKFYATDTQAYNPEKNKNFMIWIYSKLKEGYTPYLDLSAIKKLVQKITLWYEMKYPNRGFDYCQGIINAEFERIPNFSEDMDFDQLRYRLNHSELETFDCKYRSNCGYSRPDWGGHDFKVTDGNGWIDLIGFKVKAQYPDEMKVTRLLSATAIGGLISPYEMSRLEDFYPTIPTDFITIKNLINIIKGSSNMISEDLDKIEFVHETDLELRDRIINMIILALIYSKNTVPEYGIKRAHKFAEEVNNKYKINTSVPAIEELSTNEPTKSSKIEEIKLNNLKRKVKKIESKNN